MSYQMKTFFFKKYFLLNHSTQNLKTSTKLFSIIKFPMSKTAFLIFISSRLWLIAIILLSLLILTLGNAWKRFRNTPPGPVANYIPILGYLPFLNAEKPHKSLADLVGKYGKIFSLQMGSVFTVVLSDAALIREAFKRDEFSGRAPLMVTHGMFHGYGEKKKFSKF